MSHIALYRAWRPRFFRDIVGQNHITRTLKNALKEGRFSHAYLFSGPRGTGKTSAAKILAKAVNCEQGHSDGEPCDQCSACRRITEQAVMDVVEIDAASNRGVEEIRDIRDNVKYAPTEVRYKVYIIDEVHMLTTEAFNALLKTLEEPPQHVIFILATTEPNRIPPTIISRCQRFDFRRVSLQDQMKRLEHICKEENIAADADALQYIARLSAGGMRDALSLLDQIISFCGDRITYEQAVEVTGGIASEQFAAMATALSKRDVGEVLKLVETWMLEGRHIENSMESLIQYFRDLLLLQMLPDAGDLTEQVLDENTGKQIADQFTKDEIFQIIDILNHYNNEMKYASHPQTIFEIALMKICSMDRSKAVSLSGYRETTVPEVQASSIGGEGSGFASNSDKQIAQLTAKIEELERQIQVLSARTSMHANQIQRSPSGQRRLNQDSVNQGASFPPASGHQGISLSASIQAGSHDADRSLSSPSVSQSDHRAPSETNPSSPLTNKLPFVQRSAGRISKVHLQDYLDKHDAAAFAELQKNWGRILQEVKERKITVHAWLVDGEPVAFYNGKVLVAFKNTIHRETTEKPANKQLIEEVMHRIAAKPIQLDTVMLKDWNEMKANANDNMQDEQPEPLALEPDQEERESKQPEWVSEAIRLFGEDLVVVKEDDNA